MADVLLLVDVVNSFRHEDGDRLAASFRRRFPALRALLEGARDGVRLHSVAEALSSSAAA